MLELDSYYDDEQKFRTNSFNLPVNIKEPTFSEGTTALTEDIVKQSFNRYITALAEGKDVSSMVDLDYLARFLFVDEFTANFELMHPKSTFCYNENVMNSDSRYIFGPVWDFDWGFGYSGGGQYFKNYATIDYWNRTQGEGYSWAYKQRYCGEDFNKIYYNLWHDFVTSGKLDELIDFCDDYYYFAAKSFSHDNTIWNKGDATDYYDVTTRSKEWLKTRANYVLDYMTNTLEYGSKNYLKSHLSPIMGDVNGDGRITTADIVCVLNYILGLPNEDFNFTQADIDKNNIITVADLIRVRNLIGSTNSKGFYGLPVAEAAIEPEPVTTNANSVEIPLTITADQANYCAMQFDLNIPSGMIIEDIDYSKSIPDFNINISEIEAGENQSKDIDRYRVSIYSSAKNVIPQGNSTIELVLDWGSLVPNQEVLNATLSNIMFVSKLGEDERTYSRSAEFCHNSITGIDNAISDIYQSYNGITVAANQNTTMPVYTIDGRTFRVYNLKAGKHNIALPAGIYIINKQKIIVK